MRLREISYDGGRPIDSYGPGFFRVGGEVHRGPLAVLPGAVLAWAGTADAELLRARADSFDVLLVGTGASLAALPAGFRAALEATGVGLEVMATPAACRTYNMLLAEGRRIAAALLPMPAEGTAGAPAR